MQGLFFSIFAFLFTLSRYNLHHLYCLNLKYYGIKMYYMKEASVLLSITHPTFLLINAK